MLNIILNKNDYVAKGNCRHVYLYKDKYVIKVSWKETLLERRKNKKNLFKRMIKFLPMFYDENFDDLRFYLLNKNKPIYDNIPRFYGICKTNLGFGLIVEYMSNNGKRLPTLYEYIKNNGVNEKLKNEIQNLWLMLYKNNVQIRAPHSNNFLVREENDKIKIYLVDGFGSPNIIPLMDLIPFLGRKKIIKKFYKFVDMLKEDLTEYEKCFDDLKLL